ncbi:MAG: putative metal-binding motif-containing protein [Sandaracinaceae bacterium]
MRHPTFARSLLLLACGLLSACTVSSDPDAGADAQVVPDAGAPDAGPPVEVECLDPGGTIGDACAATADCSDGCFCNGTELCESGTCVAGVDPCDDDTDCTTDACEESDDSCTFDADDTVCADGDLCNGDERCLPGVGCRPGFRLACASDDPCMIGSCDPSEGCTYAIRDLDGDGFADDRCGGEDCLDDPVTGDSIFPGAAEVCGNDVDDNCDGIVDFRSPTCLGENDTCAEADVLPGAGSYVRTTRGLSGDYAIGCRATGPDAVFRFTLASAQDVEARLETDTGSGSVAIRSAASCDAGPDTYCDSSAVLARNLPAGEYVLIVKTTIPTSFLLSLTFLDATPVLPVDVCNDATLEITASGSYSGFFADVEDDYDLSCRTASSTAYRDAAYRLVLTELSDVTLTAGSTSTGSTSTYLSLVRDCTDPASALSCVQSASAEIERLSVPPGVYYVLVESSRTTASTWSLDVDIRPAMPRADGDACTTEIDVTDATATVALSSLVLDYGTTCGGSTTSARDANFAFTLTETSDVILRTVAGGIHYVSVSSACGDRTTETLCASGTPGVTRRFLRLEPGTYHVTVATTLSSGDLEVSAEVLPPTFPPDNDTCASPAPMADGVTLSGDLLAAGDSVESCGPGGSVDALHVLELTETRNVTVVARRTGGITEPLFLGLRDDCEAISTDTACTSGSPALLNRTLGPGTHHLVVESASSFVGPYSLTVYLAAP